MAQLEAQDRPYTAEGARSASITRVAEYDFVISPAAPGPSTSRQPQQPASAVDAAPLPTAARLVTQIAHRFTHSMEKGFYPAGAQACRAGDVDHARQGEGAAGKASA